MSVLPAVTLPAVPANTLIDTDMEVWHRTLDVNLLGYVRTTHAVLPYLLEQGGGSIVNTSSGGVLGTDPMHVAYTPPKPR